METWSARMHGLTPSRAQKWNDDPEAGPLCPHAEDYPIFFATQQLPSKDNRGEKI